MKKKKIMKTLKTRTGNSDNITEKDNDGECGIMQRSFSDCSIRSVGDGENERKVTLSFSSEEPYERWWGTEILSHGEGSVDLTRLNSIGCVLFNHDRDKVIGRINRAWIENERGQAEIEFDSDGDSEIVFQKVKSGTLKGVSVGYCITELEEVEEGKKSKDGNHEGPCSVAVRWIPLEISIVSIPADATVGVGRSLVQECPEPGRGEETKGVSSFYYREKQLQINQNLF